MKMLITGELPSPREGSGKSAEKFVQSVDQRAGNWDGQILEEFALLAEKCMRDANRRKERPTLRELLEALILLDFPSHSKYDAELWRGKSLKHPKATKIYV